MPVSRPSVFETVPIGHSGNSPLEMERHAGVEPATPWFEVRTGEKARDWGFCN